MGSDCTRRQLIGLVAVAGLVACRPRTAASSTGSFQIRHDGRVVRCLFHASPPTTVPPLAVVLLHGAGADASQWIDIGLAPAIDHLSVDHPTPLVGIAPDVTVDTDAAGLVLDAVVP